MERREDYVGKSGSKLDISQSISKVDKRGFTRKFPPVNILDNIRGQVTIFIIIGILIAVGVIIMFIFQNDLGISTRYGANPTKFIKDCVEKDLIFSVENIISTGGVYYSGSNDNQFMTLDGLKLSVLCSTDTPKTSCVNNHPLLREEVERTLEQTFTPKINSCFDKLRKQYANADVFFENFEFKLSLKKDFVFSRLRNVMTITREEESEVYSNFDFSFDSNLYNFIDLSNVIVTAESSCVCGANIINGQSDFTNPFLTTGPNSNCDADLQKLTVNYPTYLFTRNRLITGEKIYTITSLLPPTQNFSFVVKNCFGGNYAA